jgi:UDP-glucuronate 4-epimerase
MNILVTGGAGFIGSHLCERLLTEGHRLSIVDDLNDFYSPLEKEANLELIKKRGPVRLYRADIGDEQAVQQLVSESRPEAIVHLAGRAGVRPSLEQPLLYERVNVGGTMALLEAARQCGVRKFVFASSSSIYGVANRVPFSEDDLTNLPISPYAATKIAGEKICYTYSHLYGLDVTCLRFFTVYGPRQRPDLAIRKFTEMVDAGKPIPVFGDGTSGRDYTFVEDTVDGILRALEYDCRFDVFNLGNSNPVKLIDLIHQIETGLGKQAVLRWLPMQPGDVPITCADIQKANRLLGYEPRVSFQEGLAKFLEWYDNSKAPAAIA